VAVVVVIVVVVVVIVRWEPISKACKITQADNLNHR